MSEGPGRPFDAVLFDLDGTLLASSDAWLPALRRAYLQAARELGQSLRMPEPHELARLIGVDPRLGLERVSGELTGEQSAAVLAAFEAERAQMKLHRGAAWMPGAREALEALRASGAAIGIASYCGAGTLEFCMDELGFGRYVHSARCIDSPGIANKTDMLVDLMLEFGTRSGVMVGDREGDLEAARGAGLPGVHFSGGFVGGEEGASADGAVEDLAQLPELFAGREHSLGRALDVLVGEQGPASCAAVALCGPPGCGAESLAASLARVAVGRGLDAAARSVGEPGEWLAANGGIANGGAATFAAGRVAELRAETGGMLFLHGAGLAPEHVPGQPWIEVDAPRGVRAARLGAHEGQLEGAQAVSRLLEWTHQVGAEAASPPALRLNGARPLAPFEG